MPRQLVTRLPALRRRDFLLGIGALALGGPHVARAAATSPFLHGIASGDPLHDRVILWTRATPADVGDVVHGTWRIAKDPALRQLVARGRFRTDARRDHTVKLDVGGLRPDTTYYYRFECEGHASPIGRTRTLPRRAVPRLRLAFASCSSYAHGWFNAYARLAERADLALVVHLGDYIYENARGVYTSPDPAVAAARAVEPAEELVTLAQYRARYAFYRQDPDLQEVHRQHPFACIWDDHELANNAWRDGAEGHDPAYGEWALRRAAAVRAYHEWLPIRSARRQDTIYRRLALGDLGDLLLLDTRLVGRDLQGIPRGAGPVAPDDPRLADPVRSMLGTRQERWLAAQLHASRRRAARWQILAQQVLMAHVAPTRSASARNGDSWDGYPAARARLFATLHEQRIDSAIVLSGDTHASWCNELAPDPWSESASAVDGRGPLAVEFGCPGISSRSSARDPVASAATLTSLAPHLKYVNMQYRGYGLLDLAPDRAQGELWHVPTVDARAPGEALGAAFGVEAGRPALVAAAAASEPLPAPDPAPAV